MSKITFRADDDLIAQLEEFEASKSEVMREALRTYLDGHAPEAPVGSESDAVTGDSIDELIADRVDAIIADRLEHARAPRKPQDVNVNITLDGDSPDASIDRSPERKTTPAEGENASDEERNTCKQCGDAVPPSAVYCPNCGTKSAHRVFCECGDEIRSDWSFCPSCGRRTPAADVLDNP